MSANWPRSNEPASPDRRTSRGTRYELRGSLAVDVIREAGDRKGRVTSPLSFLPLNRISLLDLDGRKRFAGLFPGLSQTCHSQIRFSSRRAQSTRSRGADNRVRRVSSLRPSASRRSFEAGQKSPRNLRGLGTIPSMRFEMANLAYRGPEGHGSAEMETRGQRLGDELDPCLDLIPLKVTMRVLVRPSSDLITDRSTPPCDISLPCLNCVVNYTFTEELIRLGEGSLKF